MSESLEKIPESKQNSPSPEGVTKTTVEVGLYPHRDVLPSVLVSVPVYYREWLNGNLLRHIEAHLHQRMAKDSVLEINYILNYRGDRGPEIPEYALTKEIRDFLTH